MYNNLYHCAFPTTNVNSFLLTLPDTLFPLIHLFFVFFIISPPSFYFPLLVFCFEITPRSSECSLLVVFGGSYINWG